MKEATRILIVLDRSGSMGNCRKTTVEGINSFIESQRSLPGEARLKLVQFDSLHGRMQYDVILDKNLDTLELLTLDDFIPRGATPLLDAQGKAITELGKELEWLPESERPNRVIVVTITDGHENDSQEYTEVEIRRMITHQREKYNWDFVYIGANQDAVISGVSMGYLSGKSMTYDVRNTTQTFGNLSSYATRSRSVGVGQIQCNNFVEEERLTSVKE